MSSIAIPHVPSAPPRRRLTSFQTWGLIMLAPYLLVFAAFVIYPVTYGLWLARHPESYARLFADPIFLRTVLNTLVFLIVAVNLKFLLALWLSGFFVHERVWIRWVSVLFLLPWAVSSIPTLYLSSTILSMIWTLGDFNSVYLLTGGGPADLTHVLATLGIRYIRLDQVDLAMATIVCAMPLVLPLMWFMMKNLSRGDRQ